MSNKEEMFRLMYGYLQDTKNIFGTWSIGGPTKRDNLIIEARKYNRDMSDDEIIKEFEEFIEKNNLEKLNF